MDAKGMDGGTTDESPRGSTKGRGKRSTTADKSPSRARNLRLSDDVHDRLWFLARQKRQSVSAVANDILSRSLPRWDLKRQS